MRETYTLLIADDEFFILERLKRLLAQEQTDFTLLAACANGKDAMERIEALRPDLAILDIKMPFLSGLEIAERIKSLGLPTRVILLTSFDLFDFAQQAVSYHVFSYLLKPIKSEDLLQVLHDARADIQSRREQADKLKDYDNHAQEQALFLLLSGTPLPQSLDAALAPLLSTSRLWRLTLLKLNAPDSSSEYAPVVREILGAKLPPDTFFCTTLSESVVACVIDDALFDEEFAARLQRAVRIAINGSCSIAFTHAVTSDRLSACNQQALPRLYHTLFDGANTIVSAEQSLSVTKPYPFDLQRVLTPYLQQKDAISAEQALQASFWSLREHASIQNLELLLSELFLTCSLLANVSDADALTQRGQFYRVHLLLENSSCLAEIEDWCMQYLRRHVLSADSDAEGALTGSVRNLVQTSFADPALNLPYIAEKLGYTPNYISTVFKKETGLSVVQYITEQRMLAAKQLLSTQKLNVNAVCECVGYTNPFYFSRRFKAYFGYAPSDSGKA